MHVGFKSNFEVVTETVVLNLVFSSFTTIYCKFQSCLHLLIYIILVQHEYKHSSTVAFRQKICSRTYSEDKAIITAWQFKSELLEIFWKCV